MYDTNESLSWKVVGLFYVVLFLHYWPLDLMCFVYSSPFCLILEEEICILFTTEACICSKTFRDNVA